MTLGADIGIEARSGELAPPSGAATLSPFILREDLLPPPSALARYGQVIPRSVLRPLVRRIPLNAGGVGLLRLLTAGPARLARSVPGTVARPVRWGQVRGEWVLAPGVRERGRALLYVHGSAFTLLSARAYRSLASRLSDRTGLPCFSVDYRLGPEHQFPAASDDVLAAYRQLLEQGYRACDLVVVGDSAGGFLAVDLALQLARLGEPLPAGLALFSPLFDLSLQLAAVQERRTADSLVTAADCRRLVDLYLADCDREDPRVRLTFDGVTRFPPTLIQAGGNEMLQADARYLHSRIEAGGHTSHIQVWPGQMHVFQNFPALPESAVALRETALFLGWCLQLAPPAEQTATETTRTPTQ